MIYHITVVHTEPRRPDSEHKERSFSRLKRESIRHDHVWMTCVTRDFRVLVRTSRVRFLPFYRYPRRILCKGFSLQIFDSGFHVIGSYLLYHGQTQPFLAFSGSTLVYHSRPAVTLIILLSWFARLPEWTFRPSHRYLLVLSRRFITNGTPRRKPTTSTSERSLCAILVPLATSRQCDQA